MTRVQQCLLVVCVSIFIIISNFSSANTLKNVEENLQATVLVTTKKINARVDETTGNLPSLDPPNPTNPAMGSGIIISKDGYIITNHHVIANVIDNPNGQISVWTYEDQSTTEYVAKIVGYDQLSDIAVIKVDFEKDFEYSKVVWGKEPNFGDTIYIIGHPQGMMWSLSKGTVSNPKRYVNTPWQRLIQTDALIMPGNSGGPLFNEKGQLVGINTLMIFSTDPTVKTQAWSMSIHIDDVKWVVDRILEYGDTRRPALNIDVDIDTDRDLIKIRPAEGTELANLGLIQGYLLSIENNKISEIGDIFKFLKTKTDGETATITVEEIPSGEIKNYTFKLMRWDEMISSREETKETVPPGK